MPIMPPLYHAAMYLKTGHPVYKLHWDKFVQQQDCLDRDHSIVVTVARTADLTPGEVTRAIIFSLNGLDPHRARS